MGLLEGKKLGRRVSLDGVGKLVRSAITDRPLSFVQRRNRRRRIVLTKRDPLRQAELAGSH